MRIKNILSIIGAGLVATACNFLDKMPDDHKTMYMVWESQKETESYLYSIYSQIPDESNCWNACPWLGASDEADMFWERYPTASMNRGNWNPVNVYYDLWSNYYKAIRCTFIFENNVDKCYELSPALKLQYKAEVKFLRGFYYWKLLQQYGPFVLIDKEIPMDSDWNLPRTPYDDCVEYICKMLDEAEEYLPWTWKTDSKWLGKPDKIACKTVKSEVLLMAASPQWNGNTEYASFRNPDGTQLVNQVYSQDKWVAAADAAKDVITAAETMPELKIALYENNTNSPAEEFNPYKSVRDVQLEKWNCEVLWYTTKGTSGDLEKHSTPYPGGWNGIAATQRLVDAFYMLNGRTIDDPASGYKETGFAESDHPEWEEDLANVVSGDHWGNRKGEHNMFANREARFYAAILYCGRPLPQVSSEDRDYYSSTGNKDGWGRVELYGKGLSGAASGSANDHSKTGYLRLKGISPQANPYRNQFSTSRNMVYTRLATVYLNYIEALNEYDPGHADIKKYWDLIRKRAGLPSIFDTYPGIAGKTADQLEYIIRERQVELCFEGDRYFTTRRRWLSDKVDTSRPEGKRMYGDNGPTYGLNINEGTGFDSEIFYTRYKFEDRVFTKKMYLFPISQYEMDRNTQMVQNPWW